MSEVESASIEEGIRKYFPTLDSALESLSSHREEHLFKLPSWCLTPRRIVVGYSRDRRGTIVRVVPDDERKGEGEDSIETRTLNTAAEASAMMGNWTFDGSPDNIANRGFAQFSARLELVGEPPRPPEISGRELIGWGSVESALTTAYTEEQAKRDAIDLWNAAVTGEPSQSFIHSTREVFSKLHAISRRKAFLERRVHRFIDAHRGLILPAFKNCFYEHDLVLGDERRRADFIHEREAGLPALLIELESPSHRVFRKNGDLTAEVTHARGQVAEWVRFIREAPGANAKGEMSFLSGPTQALVFIGRGLEHRAKLVETRFTDTIVWTYDLLIEEARSRWNANLEEQYRLLGLPPERPFQ
jgi:hypothetical protein